MKKGFTDLEKTVIDVGLCTGCGTCVGICPIACLTIDYQDGEPLPRIMGECNNCELCVEACPGKEIPLPDLERYFLGKQRDPYKDYWGVYRQYLKGNAVDREVREAGGAGGIVSALLIYALEHGVIDGGIVAGMSTEKPWRAEPKIARSSREVIEAAGNKHVIVPNNSLLGEARKKRMQLGVVGTSCHIHGIRKMQMFGQPKDLINRIGFTIGVFCGLNYYFRGTENILKEWCGISDLSEVAKLQYRRGTWPGHFRVTTKGGREVDIPRSGCTFYLSFMYTRDRCLMCYDKTNELADISIGDYPRPHLYGKPGGWSTIIVRTKTGEQLVKAAEEAKYIATEPLDPDENERYGSGWVSRNHSKYLEDRKKYGWPTPDYHYPIKPKPVPKKAISYATMKLK